MIAKYKLGDLFLYAQTSIIEKMEKTFSWYHLPAKAVYIHQYRNVTYMPIEDGPIYQIVTNDLDAYMTYIKMVGGFALQKRSQSKFMKLFKDIKENGFFKEPYPIINKTILDKHHIAILNDGHHRLSMVRFLFGGNIEIEVFEKEMK
jgi:hypothetical protein